MKRLFVLSDTHGRPWPTLPVCDAVLFAGDLIDGASAIDDTQSNVDAATLAWQRRLAGLPAGFQLDRVIAVRGNHDIADPARFFTDADDLSTGRLRRVADGLWVGGVGWYGRKYFDLPGESDLRPRCDALRRAVMWQVMPGERVVLLTHYPPAMSPLPSEARYGSYYAAIADLVRDLRPAVIVAGHMHEWAGTIARTTLDDETLLVLPGSMGAVIEIGEGGVHAEMY